MNINESQLEFDGAQTIDYRSQLINTQKVFENISQELLTCLINVAMSGELSSADNFEVGDVFEFNESDFRNLDDQNVQLIFKVFDMINSSSATLVNINNLDGVSEESDWLSTSYDTHSNNKNTH